MELTSRDNGNQDEEFSIWLDAYDDLFSDFDPRPYSKRAVSDDFISQTKKVAGAQFGKKNTLKLLLPETVREPALEKEITGHLHAYFIKKQEYLLMERKKKKQRGLLLVSSGIILMLVASLISFKNRETIYLHLLRTLTEPAGWFMLWMGLDALIYAPEQNRLEFQFYSKMAEVNIEFANYQ